MSSTDEVERRLEELGRERRRRGQELRDTCIAESFRLIRQTSRLKVWLTLQHEPLDAFWRWVGFPQ